MQMSIRGLWNNELNYEIAIGKDLSHQFGLGVSNGENAISCSWFLANLNSNF